MSYFHDLSEASLQPPARLALTAYCLLVLSLAVRLCWDHSLCGWRDGRVLEEWRGTAKAQAAPAGDGRRATGTEKMLACLTLDVAAAAKRNGVLGESWPATVELHNLACRRPWARVRGQGWSGQAEVEKHRKRNTDSRGARMEEDSGNHSYTSPAFVCRAVLMMQRCAACGAAAAVMLCDVTCCEACTATKLGSPASWEAPRGGPATNPADVFICSFATRRWCCKMT